MRQSRDEWPLFSLGSLYFRSKRKGCFLIPIDTNNHRNNIPKDTNDFFFDQLRDNMHRPLNASAPMPTQLFQGSAFLLENFLTEIPIWRDIFHNDFQKILALVANLPRRVFVAVAVDPVS